MNWPNCLFPILLVFTSILLTSTEAFRFRKIRIRIGKKPTTRPPVVIPTECNEVSGGVCYQYCTGGGCRMECFNSKYYHSCTQSCTGKYLQQFKLTDGPFHFFPISFSGFSGWEMKLTLCRQPIFMENLHFGPNPPF